MVLQESCAQAEVTILHLGGGLSSYRRTQRYWLYIFLEEEPEPSRIAALLFLDCSSFVYSFPPFPDKQLFESAIWNLRKVKGAE